MLFDLKGRRKRLVQVVYAFLAVLFGGGLIFFGVGSSAGGGLFDAFNGGGGNSTDTSVYDKQIEKARRAVRLNAKNDAAWLAIARNEYVKATAGGDFDRTQGAFKKGATDELKRSVQAWERYLALKPKKPDAGVAASEVQAYGTLIGFGVGGTSLDLFQKAAETQAVIAKERPSPISYFQLASIHYAIGAIAKGDKASDKAIALTPKDQRNTVSAQLKDARKQGVKAKQSIKKAEERAAKAAKDARKNGQDPFGASPAQQAPLGG